MKAWILTYAVNEYDQCGEYFLCWWTQKPSVEELDNAMQREIAHIPWNRTYTAEEILEHGGGYKNDEYLWFFLREVEEGVSHES